MEVVNAARVRQQLEDSEEEEMSELEEDTWVFPLVQMKPLGIREDEQVTQVSQRFCCPLMTHFHEEQLILNAGSSSYQYIRNKHWHQFRIY